MNVGGALAHKAINGTAGAKTEFVQPTRTIRQADGVYTSEPLEVQSTFAQECSQKVCNLDTQKPSWEVFREKYKQYIPKVRYTGGGLTGEDLFSSKASEG